MLDFVCGERQFIDHAAPVYRALPPDVRGRFLVDSSLVDHATKRGIAAEPIDVTALKRAEPRSPKARPGDGPMAFVVSIGDTKIARRLGYRRFVTMEHGIGQAYIGDEHGRTNPSSAGGGARHDTVLFLAPNEYSANLWRAAYPKARVEVVGSPRLDDLPRGPVRHGPPLGKDAVVAISFHWPASVAPEADTALGEYLPALPELASRYTMLGHAHPKGEWPQRLARIYRRAGIEFVEDFEDVCRRADVYICDNSSTLYEFAATGRPVVVMNSKRYRRNVHHGLRFWDAAHVGLQVSEPQHVVGAVERALSDPWPDEREDALSRVYQPRTNGAAYAATAILDQLAAGAFQHAA
jgi:hypothetical protein